MSFDDILGSGVFDAKVLGCGVGGYRFFDDHLNEVFPNLNKFINTWSGINLLLPFDALEMPEFMPSSSIC